MNGLNKLPLKLVIVGSNSIHCKRFIQGVIDRQEFAIYLIVNAKFCEFTELTQYVVNFSFTNLRAKQQIAQILKQIQADVVHIHQANSYAWHTLRAISQLSYRPKIILTTWGSDILILPKKNHFFARMVRYNLQNADIITTDSLFMSTTIQQLLRAVSRPIHVINFGIQQLPAKQNLVIKQKLILSNRLHKPLYRIALIIHAFSQLVINGLIDMEYKLLIAANGEETTKLQGLALKLGIAGRVSFTGMIAYEELTSYYQVANIFISVPMSDGTASSLLEAMAYGCIPVLSNLPANLEWVIDGVNGFIVSNINELAKEILAAIKISADNQSYRELYSFNYDLIRRKAVFSSNIKKFIELYTHRL